MSSAQPHFTGYQRQRKTRMSVRFWEIFSRGLIAGGGIGTIVAIILVAVFLVWVASPLFFGATFQETATYKAPWNQVVGQAVPAASNRQPGLLQFGTDPDQVLGWALLADGTII